MNKKDMIYELQNVQAVLRSQACIVRGIVKKLQKELKDDIH